MPQGVKRLVDSSLSANGHLIPHPQLREYEWMLGYKATELDIDSHYNITYRALFFFPCYISISNLLRSGGFHAQGF